MTRQAITQIREGERWGRASGGVLEREGLGREQQPQGSPGLRGGERAVWPGGQGSGKELKTW